MQQKVYNNAPSQNLKDYYRVAFDISPFVMGDDYDDSKDIKHPKVWNVKTWSRQIAPGASAVVY